MWRRALGLLLVVACSGCEEMGDAPPGAGHAGAGGVVEQGGGGGVPQTDVGLRWACSPGELELPDGSCAAAGIAPEACGDHFAADGARACVPIVPDEDCPPGEMAIPGERACRPVVACAAGRWGDIPLEPGAVYVDAAASAPHDGSAAAPYPTLQEAITAAAPGSLVAIAAGSYQGPVVVSGKALRLWGACPAEVTISASDEHAIILEGAGGSELHHVAATAPAFRAVSVGDSEGVLLDGVWLRDSYAGLYLTPASGPVSATLRGSLIESNDFAGVLAFASPLTVEDCVVRGTGIPTGGGYGIDVESTSDPALTPVAIRRSYLLHNAGTAIYLDGVDAVVRDVAVRDAGHYGNARGVTVLPHSSALIPSSVDAERVIVEQAGGAGWLLDDAVGRVEALTVRDTVALTANDGDGLHLFSAYGLVNDAGALTLRFSTIERTLISGVYAVGSRATLEGVIVRDVAGVHVTGVEHNGGIVASRDDLPPFEQALIVVRGSVVERVEEVGILALGAHVEVEGTRVADVLESSAGEGYGRGIHFFVYSEAQPFTSSGCVVGSLIERVHEFGVGVDGGHVEVDNTAVRDVAPTARRNAYCYLAQFYSDQAIPIHTPSVLSLVASEASDCPTAGVAILGSAAVVTRALVERIGSNAAGSFGDGIDVVDATSVDDTLVASLDLSRSLIAEVERAGLAVFGATATVRDVELRCDAIELDQEPAGDKPGDLKDGSGNLCHCEGVTRRCQAQSHGLEPPGAP